VTSEDDVGKSTYERVSAIAEKLDDAGRQEFVTLLIDQDRLFRTAGWLPEPQRSIQRWLRDAGWLPR
jgi:hypothetical protein